MLEVIDVSKNFGMHNALSNVSFTVQNGQILGLLGENGAGKSTLLNIISGCLAPASGTVKINGFDITDEHRQAKRCIGYLAETVPLYDEMTVRACLKFVCEIREMLDADIPGHIDEIAHMTGITDFLDRRAGNLSKGMRQRVGIAQAICSFPEIIILDEPSVGLDPSQNAEFRKLIKALSSRSAIIISSHILSELQAICTRCLILHAGRLIYDSDIHSENASSLRLRLSVRYDTGKLLSALRTLPCILKAVRTESETPGISNVEVFCRPGADAETAVFHLLSGMDAPILRMYPAKDSLEDIFLNITGK